MTRLQITLDGTPYEVEIGAGGDVTQVTVNGQPLTVTAPQTETTVLDVEWLIVDGRPYELGFDAGLQWVKVYDGLHTVEVHDLNEHVTRPRSGDGRVKAPIPGLISRVLVAPGTAVTAGQALVVLEAMKMENEIRAPFDGVVTAVPVTPGQTVLRNAVLAEVQ